MLDADGGCLAHAVVVGLQSLIAEVQVQSQASPCYICGGQSGTGQVFLKKFCFPLSVSFQQFCMLIHSSTTDTI